MLAKKSFYRLLACCALCLAAITGCFAEDNPPLPDFGRDTVLVWEDALQDGTKDFVVRLASFYPDLLMEWENLRSQGTVSIPNRDVLGAKGYVNKKLFKPGMDTQSEDETTLWLSRKIFRELKEKKKAKCKIDRVQGKMTYEGDEELTVNINGVPVTLPVIRVRDDRGSERWFLDLETNPLMVKYTVRHFEQTLISITTNRTDTLRWLKGRKLQRFLTK